MPQFLQDPTHSKFIRQLRSRSPVQYSLIVLLRPRPNPLSSNSELPTANIPNFAGNPFDGNVEDRLVCVGKVCADIMGVDVGLRRAQGVHACRTAWVELAAEVDISMSIDGLISDVSQGIVRPWSE